MYAYLELQTGNESRRIRLTFQDVEGGFKLVQIQMEGGGRLVISHGKIFPRAEVDIGAPKIWGEDLGLGNVWLDLIPVPRLPTFSWRP